MKPFPPPLVRYRIAVSGQVQGVFYRASTQVEALKRNLTGWVQNQPDGSVLIEAQGEAEAVQSLLEWCRTGPPAAQVQRVAGSAKPIVPHEGSFDVRR